MADEAPVEFLTARLDEDEAAARAATPGSWVAHLGSELHEDSAGWVGATTGQVPGGTFVASVSNHADGLNDVGHIARHDPARVLREVEAKRAIVGLHRITEHETYRGGPCCARCTAYGEYPADDESTDEQNWPCPTLRHLAAVYADHPDYREEWKP